MGCKGKSVLSSAIDLTEAMTVDYMHAVLEGISRKLLQRIIHVAFILEEI